MYRNSLKIFLTVSILIGCVPASFSTETHPAPTAATSTQVGAAHWWGDTVFYEIFVRSFYDSDGNGVGDFNGITAKLDYLNDGNPQTKSDLGITGIWLMPIFPSPSYHGYDVTDYYGVNPQYGTMDDFKRLVDEAHKRGIHVVIDMVLNHTSDQHPWFKEAKKDINSPYRDWYIWSETNPGYKGPWSQDVWHPSLTGYYYGIFEAFMPDLNYTNPAVTEAMYKINDYWLNKIGVDGFRIDAVKHLIEQDGKLENTPHTHEWLKAYYKNYKSSNPNAYTIGEVYGAGSSVIKQYTGTELDHIFSFEMATGIMGSVNGGSNSGITSAVKFAQMDTPDYNYATFLTNHDQNRVMSVFGGDVNKAKVAAFLMLTLPGTPYIYYGEEIGMQGKKPDEDIRLPMQWSADEFAGFSTVQPWRASFDDYTQTNVEVETGDAASLLEHYRTLIQLRKAHPTLQTADISLLDAENSGIFAMLRADANGTYLVITNLTDSEISDYSLDLNQAGLAEPIGSVETVFGTEQAQVPERSGEAFNPYKPFENLHPYAMYVLELNP